MTPRTLLAHLHVKDPRRFDMALAALVGLEMQLEALLLAESAGAQAAAHAIGVALALAVALHRRATWPAFLISQVVFVWAQASGTQLTDHLVLPLFVVLLLSVSAAAQVSRERFWLVPLCTLVCGFLGLAVDDYPDAVGSYVISAVIFTGATAAGGRLFANRMSLQHALREKAARAEAEQAERAERAVLDERERIAGELHDVIAHAVSGMVVQASAARRLVDRDAKAAREAFATVEDSGRDALAELRRLLGVLRHEDEDLALSPTPSLAHLAALARRTTAAGLLVHLDVQGTPVDLPAGVDVTAYRVVQEALRVALEASGAGRANVVVRYRDDDVELEVRDDGPRGGDAAERLVGVRERVGLFGGEFRAGRPVQGGHVAWARLPMETAA